MVAASPGRRRCDAAAIGVDHDGSWFESCAGPRDEFLQRHRCYGPSEARREQEVRGTRPGLRAGTGGT
jgi:hypothetical protein